ncbi:MAG: hypothetical protein IIW33_03620, partial [Oscillospiraceae bacterium]|nr:hypothetical protein [Oscillospiraceae bacterium]
IDAMLDKKLLGDSVGKYILKNVLAEGMEEGLSNIGNTVVELIDLGVNTMLSSGDKSKIKREIAMIMQEQGISESEAVGKYVSGLFKELGLDVLGGALSGGAVGGGGVAIHTAFNKATTVAEKNQVLDFIIKDEETLTALINEGKELGGNAAIIAQQIETAKKNGKLTRREIKLLIETNEAAIKSAEQTQPEADTLEKAAMDVVNERYGVQTKPFAFTEAQKATGFGNYGSELVTSIANSEGITLDQAKKNVETAYLAGFTNMDKSKANFVTETQEKAFDAGKRDAIMQNTAAKKKAKTATVYGKDSGVIKNEYYEKLSPAEQEMFSVFARDFGESAEVVNEIVVAVIKGKKYTASAEHSDGKVRGSATTQKPVHQWILHENGHRMEQFATDEWNTLSNALYARAEQLGRRIKSGISEGMAYDSVKNQYDSTGQNLSTRGYVGEVVMRELETIFSSAEEFNAWRAELDAKPQVKSAWAKFMEWLTEILEKIKAIVANRKLSPEARAAAKAEIAELERIKELYADAYKATRIAVAERTAAVEKAKTEKSKTKQAKTTTKQTETQTEPDTLEKAAKDVVDKRNAKESAKTVIKASESKVSDQTPTSEVKEPKKPSNAVVATPETDVQRNESHTRINKSDFKVIDVNDSQFDNYGVKLYPKRNLSNGEISQLEKTLREKLKGVPNGKEFAVTTVTDKNGQQIISVTADHPIVLDSDILFDDVAASLDDATKTKIMREAARAVVADIESGLSKGELMEKSFKAITEQNRILNGLGGRKITNEELQELELQRNKYFYYKEASENPQGMLSKHKSFAEGEQTQTETKKQDSETKEASKNNTMTEKTLFDKYNEVKQEYPNNIVLYRVGDFFEVLGEDAKAVAEWADLTLTSRNNPNSGRVPMVGFPYHKLESFVEKIRKHQNVTLIQEENGVAKEGSLRTARCISSGITFVGEIRCSAADEEFIKEILSLVKWVG